MINPPCKDCQERHESCHSHCKKYLAFAKEREIIREQKFRENQLKQNLYAIAIERSKAAQNKAREKTIRRRRGEHK